jgi:hypothetical protein
MAGEQTNGKREMLLVSDFDQTLSFNDSGIVLSEMLGIGGFEERVAGLAKIHLIQQSGGKAYPPKGKYQVDARASEATRRL